MKITIVSFVRQLKSDLKITHEVGRCVCYIGFISITHSFSAYILNMLMYCIYSTYCDTFLYVRRCYQFAAILTSETLLFCISLWFFTSKKSVYQAHQTFQASSVEINSSWGKIKENSRWYRIKCQSVRCDAVLLYCSVYS